MPDFRRGLLHKSQLADYDSWLPKLEAMSREELLSETEQYIWLSAYAANNPRSIYHDKCDACYAEWKRRGDENGYQIAWNRAAAQ